MVHQFDHIKRIVLSCPESTGKTTLAGQLANYYHTVWMPEYARMHIKNLTRSYTYSDIIHIAREQIALRKKYLAKAKYYLFFDTDLLNIKVWLLYKYNRCPQWLLAEIDKSAYDLYLLCSPDLAWRSDSARENPDIREALFKRYKKEIEQCHVPCKVIHGTGKDRMHNAVQIVNNFLEHYGE